jgi:hypothetical protein
LAHDHWANIRHAGGKSDINPIQAAERKEGAAVKRIHDSTRANYGRDVRLSYAIGECYGLGK